MDIIIPVGTDWREDLAQWLAPFLAVFKRSEQRFWAPFYLHGLLGPGARKSVEPMAERVCPGQTQQLHHFVSTSPWSTAPLEQVLHKTADSLVGGQDAVLIVDDTALPKQGKHSVGVKRQHCGVLGKQANCQVLVSLTLAHQLKQEGHQVGRKHVATLMKKMGIEALYKKPNTSRHPAHPVYPYLLRNLEVHRPNQVFAADITYIPM